MQPLDLVVIALTLEDEEHFAFPFERLADVHTVRDLANAARDYGQERTPFFPAPIGSAFARST